MNAENKIDSEHFRGEKKTLCETHHTALRR